MSEESLLKLTKDLKRAVTAMTADEARFLVDNYYIMQDNRKRSEGQIRSMQTEPHETIAWLSSNAAFLENQIKIALRYFAESQHMGRWAMQFKGIGPVIASGLIAHIKIDEAPTVGHIWRFAGLDPTSKWEKGQKRPHNAALKQICYHIGEEFVRQRTPLYRDLYDQRKAYETEKNERGEYAQQAEAVLKRTPNHAQRATYKQGKLPDGHIHFRAKRYVVKLFLSHWHGEAYRNKFGTEPPLPYPIAHLGHAHVI